MSCQEGITTIKWPTSLHFNGMTTSIPAKTAAPIKAQLKQAGLSVLDVIVYTRVPP